MPVFYYRREVGNGADKWIIRFKGGGSAHTLGDFAGRSPTLTSANPWLEPEYDQLGSSGHDSSADGEAGGILSSIRASPKTSAWQLGAL